MDQPGCFHGQCRLQYPGMRTWRFQLARMAFPMKRRLWTNLAVSMDSVDCSTLGWGLGGFSWLGWPSYEEKEVTDQACYSYLDASRPSNILSAFQERICIDSFRCCYTEIQVTDPACCLTQSQYTDAAPTVLALTLECQAPGRLDTTSLCESLNDWRRYGGIGSMVWHCWGRHLAALLTRQSWTKEV